MSVVIGIDTSNYATSISLVSNGVVIENFKKMLPVKNGTCGLRQNETIFLHLSNIRCMIPLIGKQSISAIACSTKPRNLIDSYMPCFMVGQTIADTISNLFCVKCFYFSHQEGHIMSALYSSKKMDLFDKRFISFHISGGTSEVLLCEHGIISKIGGTKDISFGKLIDRIGVMMGYQFPAGVKIEQSFDFELINVINKKYFKTCVNNLEFNLSGIENLGSKLYDVTKNKRIVSTYIIYMTYIILDKLTEQVKKLYGDLPIIFSGGVMSNTFIQKMLSNYSNTFFASPEFSSDNAAGIALLGEKKLLI